MATWFLQDKYRNMPSRCSTRFVASLILLLVFSLAVSYAYLPPEFVIQQGFTTINNSPVLPASHSRLATTHQKTAQRARGKLIQEVKENFNVDAFIGNATDWERVCMGNLVGLPVIVVPTGFRDIPNPPPTGTRRRTTVNTGIYAPPNHDHIALALAMAYQSATNHHKQRPPIDDLGPNDTMPNPPHGSPSS